MSRLSRTLGERGNPLLPPSPSMSRASSAQPWSDWSQRSLDGPIDLSHHQAYMPPRSHSASFPLSTALSPSTLPTNAPTSPRSRSSSTTSSSDDPADVPVDPSTSAAAKAGSGCSGRLVSLVSRFPVLVMLLCLLPTVLSVVVLLVPRGFDLHIDYTYDQFKIQGDAATVYDDMNAAARAVSFAVNKPPTDVTQSVGAFQDDRDNADLHAGPANANATAHAFTTSSLVSEVAPPPSLFAAQRSRGFHTQQYIHRAYIGEVLTVIYAAEPAKGVTNLLSSSVIRRIKAIERAITSAPGYDSHCRVYYQGDSMGQCILPSTFLNFVYASKLTDRTLVFDGRGAELMDPTAVTTGLLMNGLNGFFDRKCTLTNVRSSTLISQFTFGLPLPGYADINDRLLQQRRQLNAWMVQFDGILRGYDGVAGMRVLREGGDIVQAEIDAILARDLVTVFGSIALVFVYMLWHTRSLFLTLASMLMMAAAFPPVTLAYRTLFGTSMSLMNVVSVWLILGIGTDDVFIYVDMWAQYAAATAIGAKAVDPSTAAVDLSQAGLSARLSWTYRKAASAMLVTSFTTAAGFFSTSVSLLLPIRQFGFFLGSVVVVNYLLVISFFPAAVIAHAKHRRRLNAILCCGQHRLVMGLWARLLRRRPAQVAEEDVEEARCAAQSDAEAALEQALWQAQCSSIVSPPRSPTAVMELLDVGRAQPSPPPIKAKKPSRMAELGQSLLGDEHKEPSDAVSAPGSPWALSSLLASLQALVKQTGAAPAPSSDPPGSEPLSLRDRVVLAWMGWVYRLRWVVLAGFVVFVVLLTVRIPELRTPNELPQILPSDSNVELLRAFKKQLSCDRCVQGGLNIEPNNAPATCPISVCHDPADFAGCEDVDCGSGGMCQLGVCNCYPGFSGRRCDGVDVCYGADCGLHGSCSNSTGAGRCVCRDDWTGENCDIAPICKNVNCGEHGVCSDDDGACLCLDGFTGAQCQVAPPEPPINPNASTTVLPISAALSVEVYFLFGVEGVDMSNADNANPGQPLFDPAFDPSTPAAQTYLLAFCRALLYNNSHARSEMFRCPILSYQQWVKNSMGVQEWPVPQATFTPTFLQWMRSYDGRDFERDAGFEVLPGTPTANGTLGPATARVTFLRVSTRTSVDKDLSGLLVQAEYDWWERWFAGWDGVAPAEARGVQTSATWPRMKTELAFISGTLTSLLLSIVIVSGSILLFTHNVWLMLYTTVVIASIVLCLLGLFVLWGWPLGALEAISVPLVVGLSVDYCLHLSHAYTEAAKDGAGGKAEGGEKGRQGRVAQTRRALLRIGPSITAAALTTIACMSVLLLCRIVVFVEFGIVVAVTLALGLAFTMTAFLAALQVAGPTGTQGDIRHTGKRIYTAVRRCTGTLIGGELNNGEEVEEKDAVEDGSRPQSAGRRTAFPERSGYSSALMSS